MGVVEKINVTQEVNWRVVPKSLRPDGVHLEGKRQSGLYLVKQDWHIEFVGLTESGRLNIQGLDKEEPMLYASLT